MTATDPRPKLKPLFDDARDRARRGARLLTHWWVRTALILLALAVLVLPFFAATQYYLYQRYMSKQAVPPVTNIDATTAAAATRMAQVLPAATAPVVLTYHDINTHNPSQYVVTPAAFDAQMTALEKAGYRSMTADEFVDYLRGGPAPPRSVFITFDDGPRGLWANADRILGRHHLHGTVFLITSRVDDRPYYLSWREIGRMARSGRWDFQAHTHDLHHRQRMDAAGHRASALSHRIWLPDRHRLETRSEYQARVTADITKNLGEFKHHGLPKPELFAYPFGEATDRGNLPPGVTLRGLLYQHYMATMSNESPDPLLPPVAASRRAAAERTVQRLEVLNSTTADKLLNEIGQWTQTPPAATDPLTQPALWTRNDGAGRTGIEVFTRGRRFPGKEHYAAAEYRALGSVDWTDYRVDATVTRLGDGTNQAAVALRDRSNDPVVISVSQGTATLQHSGHRAVVRRLAPNSSHTLSISVHGPTTTALVDGATALSWTAKGISPFGLTGGFGIRVGSNQAGVAPPAFSALHLSPLPEKTPAAKKSSVPLGRQALTASAPPAPVPYWESAPGVQAPFQIKDDAITPLSRSRLSVYGAYQPARTHEWTAYTASGTVSKLYDPSVKGAIQVKVGSPQVISVQVSHGLLEVLVGNADSQRLAGTRSLKAADSHDVSVSVNRRSTVISVDGTTELTLPADGERGGVAYAAYRQTTRTSWPTVSHLTVAPVAGG